MNTPKPRSWALLLLTLLAISCKPSGQSSLKYKVGNDSVDTQGLPTTELQAHIDSLRPSVRDLMNQATVVAKSPDSNCSNFLNKVFFRLNPNFKPLNEGACHQTPPDQHEGFTYLHAAWNDRLLDTATRAKQDLDRLIKSPGFSPRPGDIIQYKLIDGPKEEHHFSLIVHPEKCIRFSFLGFFANSQQKNANISGARFNYVDDLKICNRGRWFEFGSDFIPVAILRHKSLDFSVDSSICDQEKFPSTYAGFQADEWNDDLGSPMPNRPPHGHLMPVAHDDAPKLYGCYHRAVSLQDLSFKYNDNLQPFESELPNFAHQCLKSPREALELWSGSQLFKLMAFDQTNFETDATLKEKLTGSTSILDASQRVDDVKNSLNNAEISYPEGNAHTSISLRYNKAFDDEFLGIICGQNRAKSGLDNLDRILP